MEIQKLRKWPISKSISFTGTHVRPIKRLTVNSDTQRQDNI